MKRNPKFFLKKIGAECYLVPFGQEIENIRPSMRMTEASSFLWEALPLCDDEDEITLVLAREYEVPKDELPEIKRGVRTIISQLRVIGAVGDSFPEEKLLSVDSCTSVFDQEIWKALRGREQEYQDVMIGGLLIRQYGSTEYFPDQLNDFCVQCDKSPDITVIVTEETPPETNDIPVLIKGQTVTVLDGGGFYLIRSAETPAIREAHILKDGYRAVFYMTTGEGDVGTNCEQETTCHSSGSKELLSEETETGAEQSDNPADAVFHMLRHVFMICAEKRDMYIIHSASILHDGRAWLFSALSGTGKSTHTNLWHKLYGTPYLDGDLNLLAFEDGRPVVKGIPWCGTSGIYTTETWPLGGIILLARDPKNYVEELSYGTKALGISMRFISPKWNEEMLRGVLDFSERIAKSSGICRLHCNMEDEAAEVCRAWIDGREA